MNFDFTIQKICIPNCSLKYDVHVVTCLHEFRRFYEWSILINFDEWNFLILIHQCSDTKLENVKRWTFASGQKSKGVWITRTNIHKSLNKSTDAFNIERRKIHLNHKPRGKVWDISGWISGNFSCFGQDTNRSGLFQVTDILWETFHEDFYCH